MFIITYASSLLTKKFSELNFKDTLLWLLSWINNFENLFHQFFYFGLLLVIKVHVLRSLMAIYMYTK